MSSLSGGMGPTGYNKRGGTGGDIIPKGYRKGRMQNFTPEQMQLFQDSFQHLGPDSYLSRLAGGDEDIMNEIEAPAMRQFNEMQGGLASRFSGMGSGGRRSSGFQNSATAATSNFAQDLQSRRQQLRQQAIKDLMGMSNELLGQRPYDNFMVEKQQKQNPWADIGGRFASAIPGAVAGFAMGGPAGAAAGAASGFTAPVALQGGGAMGSAWG